MRAQLVESTLLDALTSVTSRRLAERVLADALRMRGAAGLPTTHDQIRAFVRLELADAAFLRLGARAEEALVAVEDRLALVAAEPPSGWVGPRDRIVFVGRDPERARVVAEALDCDDIVRVEELHQLFVALEEETRILVLVDAADSPLDPDELARFVPDFPPNVSTLVARSSTRTRDSFVKSGALFRTTLRPEPLEDPMVAESAIAALRTGHGPPSKRRRSAGTTSTTDPRRAA